MNASEAIAAIEQYSLHVFPVQTGWYVYHEKEWVSEGETAIAAVEAAAAKLGKDDRMMVAHFPPFGAA